MTDMNLGLSNSDVNYLKTYKSEVLNDTSLDNIEPLNTADQLESDVVEASQIQSLGDSSGDLQQQFAHLQIPSDSIENLSDGNHCVQSLTPNGNLIGMIDVPSKMTNGLKVVGHIPVPVPFSSSTQVSTTTLSYATAPTTMAEGDTEIEST